MLNLVNLEGDELRRHLCEERVWAVEVGRLQRVTDTNAAESHVNSAQSLNV